jgi:hydrogenase maturation protease
VRLTPERLAEACATRLTHGMGLAETLELLAALGLRPAPISIYAVQPAVVGWGPGLSREVAAALAAVATAIRQELCLPNPRRARTVLRTDEEVRCLPGCGQAA